MTNDAVNIDLLLERQRIVEQLKKIADECLETSKRSISAEEKRKLPFLKCAVYCYSVILHCIKDSESDIINARIDQLERKLKH